MRNIVILLHALPLALLCPLRYCLRKESHELFDGTSLEEGERGQVTGGAQYAGGAARGCEEDGDGEDLDGSLSSRDRVWVVKSFVKPGRDWKRSG